MNIKSLIKNTLNKFNINIMYKTPYNKIDKTFYNLYQKCKDYTMTSEERMYSLYNAVKYVVKAGIKGSIVECGVWKGGSMMISALTLMKMNDKKRRLYLYDTFEGMSTPTKEDKTIYDSKDTMKKWESMQKEEGNEWCYAGLEEVKSNMYSTKYPKNKIKFVKGKVEETLLKTKPKKIAVLRLDTDWYKSTYAEMKHLYPLLSKGGVIIIDDYGHWQGSKKAVDKYFKEKKINILLHSIDYSGRIGIKN